MSDVGCYLVTDVQVGEMPDPVFWHLYTYPTMAAAEAARAKTDRRAITRQVLGLHPGRPGLAGGARRPRVGVGPLQIKPGTRYTARYMESILPPSVKAVSAHSHSGPEAFYIVSGAQCLDAPEATTVSRAGESVIMQAGPPMALNGLGTENRAAVFLVLHDSTQPWVSRGGTWNPPDAVRGDAPACPRRTKPDGPAESGYHLRF